MLGEKLSIRTKCIPF